MQQEISLTSLIKLFIFDFKSRKCILFAFIIYHIYVTLNFVRQFIIYVRGINNSIPENLLPEYSSEYKLIYGQMCIIFYIIYVVFLLKKEI